MKAPNPQSPAAPEPSRLAAADLCVAPMMAWTTRHCRMLHRLFAPHALLFTEMVTTGALLRGGRLEGLEFDPAEQPLALQLGGADPADLARAADLAGQRGFAEINLNVGCPSDRVQSGQFGACLMKTPERVAACIAAMGEATAVPVTVKCRLGVDDQESDEFVGDFLEQIARAGARRIYLHARKAILGRLTPAQNRSIPPLKYEQAYRLAQHFSARYPALEFVMNGGIASLEEAQRHRDAGFGVMIGRAAWHNPMLLAALNDRWFGTRAPTLPELCERYLCYAQQALQAGANTGDLARPLLGVVNGRPGARRFRQSLTAPGSARRRDLAPLQDALALLRPEAA